MTVKTTISLPEELFERLEHEAEESGTARSRVVAKALEEHFREHEKAAHRKILDEVYGQPPTDEDRKLEAFLQRAARNTFSEMD